MRTFALLVATTAGCSYDPGAFSYPGRQFPGQRVTVGCLDISVDRRADMDDKVVVNYQFGNRCNESVVVDLVRVPVTGRTTMGDEVTLAAFDPKTELIALKLGARQAGGEAIAYPYPTAHALTQICVDAAAIYAGAREHRWLCFGSKEPNVEPTPLPAPEPLVAEVTP